MFIPLLQNLTYPMVKKETNGDTTQTQTATKSKLWDNLKTLIVTKLKILDREKLRNSKCEKT